MRVADKARQILAKLKDYGGWEGVGLYVPESGEKGRKQVESLCERKILIEILEAAIPALDREEERQDMISAFRSSRQSPAPIIAVPDEPVERRTLAIAQMAAVIASAMHAIDGPWEHRQRIAVDRARDILAEVEKQ